jgi:hypothetical protein
MSEQRRNSDSNSQMPCQCFPHIESFIMSHLCQGLRFVGGLVFSILFGHYFIKWAKNIFWYCYLTNYEKPKPGPSAVTGNVERFLYTCALVVGAWQWVGVWLVMKVAARWTMEKDTDPNLQSANIHFFLIGSGLSVAFGFLGAWFTLWKLPVLK